MERVASTTCHMRRARYRSLRNRDCESGLLMSRAAGSTMKHARRNTVELGLDQICNKHRVAPTWITRSVARASTPGCPGRTHKKRGMFLHVGLRQNGSQDAWHVLPHWDVRYGGKRLVAIHKMRGTCLHTKLCQNGSQTAWRVPPNRAVPNGNG